jgi:hypothetical protein
MKRCMKDVKKMRISCLLSKSLPCGHPVCVECLIGKQKKPILFKVTEPSSIPYRTPSACAKRAAYPDPPPVILLPESSVAQAAYAETLLPGSAPSRENLQKSSLWVFPRHKTPFGHLRTCVWRCFGLWSQVFHGNVGIRRSLKSVGRMRAARDGGHHRGPLATPAMQAVLDSWMALATRRAFGLRDFEW